MRQRELKKLKAMVAKLTFNQRRDLMDDLPTVGEAAISIDLIETQGKQSRCPNFASERVVRNGSASGLQRIRSWQS